MSRTKEPAGGWPWKAPGFTFSIGWPYGFVSQIEHDNSALLSARSTASRAEQVAKGNTGSVFGISQSADKRCAQFILEAKKAALRGGR